ncbi:MAG: exosome complex protein Rrp42 [Candidatus Woesearchaeota archaeon]
MNLDIKDHIAKSLAQGIRMDGRKNDEFRPITVETNVTGTADGSARVTCGDTMVIAGIKLGLGTPFPDTPNNGVLMVNAELLPLSNPHFEGGPPSIDSIETSRVIDRGIREGEAMDTKQLVVKAGEKVWMVSVDVIPLNHDGNLIDVGGLATMAALKTTYFPEVKDGKVVDKGKSKKKLPLKSEPLPITVFRIGDTFIVDPTEEEESASDCRLTVAFEADGSLCAMQKTGGPLMLDEIKQMITMGKKASLVVRKNLGGLK